MKSLQSVPAIKGDVPGRRGPRVRLARAVRRVTRAVAGRVGRWAGLATLGSVRAITRQLEDRPADYLLGLEPTKEFTP